MRRRPPLQRQVTAMDQGQFQVQRDGVADAGRPRASWASRVLPYLAALTACLVISAASYPGFMSYDSLEALRQGREQVAGGPYPPFGMYVWRVMDWIWPGPTLMQLAQNGLLLLSLAYIVRKIRLPIYAQLVAIVVFAFLPPLFGIMLVVWKDVAVAACLLAALALAMYIPGGVRWRKAAVVGALVMLFSGMAYRYNAGSAVFPLAAYFAYGLFRRFGERRRILASLVAGGVLTVGLFAVVLFVNTRRFPSMERLAPSENTSYTQNYDLIGISVHAPVSVYPDGKGGYVPRAYLERIYDPLHINITMENDRLHAIQVPPDLSSRWLEAVRRYPEAYFQHRSDVFGEYLAFNDRPVFYPTHGGVDANKHGITYSPTRLSNMAVAYVVRAAQGWISRPWAHLAAGFLALLAMYALKARSYRPEALAVYASGIFYALPMYIIAPAADLRYNFWSICASVVTITIAVAAISQRRAPGF